MLCNGQAALCRCVHLGLAIAKHHCARLNSKACIIGRLCGTLHDTDGLTVQSSTGGGAMHHMLHIHYCAERMNALIGRLIDVCMCLLLSRAYAGLIACGVVLC